MKRNISSRVLILVLIVIGSSGCTSGPLSTSTGTAVASPTSAFAPSYDEIKQNIESITKTEGHPEGPEVGDDGIVDPKIREALTSYQDSLAGKKVEGWEVWVLDYTKTDSDDPNSGYNLSLTTKEPIDTSETLFQVQIYNFPREQFEKLRLWKAAGTDPQKTFGSCIGPCQRALLRGTVESIQSDAVVWIGNATLEPTE